MKKAQNRSNGMEHKRSHVNLMNERIFLTSACRYCGFYNPQGRRGGSCQRLGVPVEGNWKACAFASHPFDTTLKKLEDIFQLPTPVESCSDVQPTPKVTKIQKKQKAKKIKLLETAKQPKSA